MNLKEAALLYADLGYSVFPLRPLEKRPIRSSHGVLEATTNEETIDSWWNEHPNANIGFSTNGLLVLDIDGDNNPWLHEDETRLSSLTSGYAQRTPNGGIHYLFRQPEGRSWRNTASKIAPNIDTRANGGYIIVPPSGLAGKRNYNWIPGYELDVSFENLLLPPTWLIDLLDELENKKNGYQVVAAGEKIIKGARNDYLTRFGGALRRKGCSERVLRAALQEHNEEACDPPLRENEVFGIARSLCRYEPNAIEEILAKGGVFCDAPKDTGPEWPGPFPKSLLEVSGFIREFIAYTLSISYRPQPILALAASLSLLGTIIGRKVVDCQNTHPNIYAIGLCGSGGGKDSARKASKNLLVTAGLDEYLGPESFASSAGLVSAVAEQSPILFQVDEFGRYLETVHNPSRSPHLFHIVTILLKMFSSVGTLYKGDAYGDYKRNRDINWPHACLYCTATPKTFAESLTKEQLTEGFISRLLVFESEDSRTKKRVTRGDPPASLIEFLQSWSQFKPEISGNLSKINPKPNWLPVSAEGELCYDALEKIAEEEEDKDTDFGPIWTRTVEKARKLGLLRACSRLGPQIEMIEEEDASWGCQLSEYLSRRMAFMAHRNVFENARERDVQKFSDFIDRGGESGKSKTQVTWKFKRLKVKDREEILNDLVESGRITCKDIVTNGRPKRLYISMGHVKIEGFLNGNGAQKQKE